MKLLLPVFNHRTAQSIQFKLVAGASIFNPKFLGVGLPEADLVLRAWKGFEIKNESRLSFEGGRHLNFYLDEVFSDSEMENITLVTAEFDETVLPPSLIQAQYGLYEAKTLLKAPTMEAGVLYDMIADKRPGHRYSPIIHPFHTGVVHKGEGFARADTFCLFVNFRPPSLRPKAESLHKPFEGAQTQKMWMGLKKAAGNLVSEKILNLDYNSTDLISLGDAFAAFGGYQDGDQLVFKGGASQFAVFTLFVNHPFQSIGIEHSLPPVYYSSGLFSPQKRGQFYSRAFHRFENKEL